MGGAAAASKQAAGRWRAQACKMNDEFLVEIWMQHPFDANLRKHATEHLNTFSSLVFIPRRRVLGP
jgi:hypothetical protein